MEIVLGILLLFGAFTLGAVTSGNDDNDTNTAQIEIDAYGHHEQAVAASPLQECQASGSAVTYRDLTIPYIQHIQRSDQKSTLAGDCEVDCWDE